MKREIRIRVYALFLTLALVMPMGISLKHAVHDHNRLVCHAKYESHIHKQSTDCDHEHYFNQGGVFESIVSHENRMVPVYEPISFAPESKKSTSPVSNLKLRGPPLIIV